MTDVGNDRAAAPRTILVVDRSRCCGSRSARVDLVLSDVRMPEIDGLSLLAHVRRIAPQTPVIMMTAYGTVDSAVAAMRAGARDYLLKPVQFDDLLLKIERAIEFGEMTRQRDTVVDELAAGSAFHDIVSEAPSMRALFDRARTLSEVKSNVLIVGESGTGKELFARAIHYNGVTRGKPFVAVNCGAIPESLLESELFGHRKGSFTGAIRDRVGYFEAANGGTLFLDELSSLPRPGAIAANPADVASIDAVLVAYYAAISGPPGVERDWDRFRSLFMDGARLITVKTAAGRGLPYVMSVEDYVRSSSAYFAQSGYREREIHRRTDGFGVIAHVLSTYESRRGAADAAPYARGVNSVQLVHDGERWWIATIMWDHERAANPLPLEYLPPGG